MRLLHTSDWHLGQELHRHDRLHEHEKFLKWLIGTIVENNVDVLLVAGDIFDVSNPPAAAQRLFFNFVMEVTQAAKGIRIVVTAGNHDSASRLEAPSDMLKVFSTHVVGRVWNGIDGLNSHGSFVIPLSKKDGSAPEALCLALPYLRAGDVFLAGESIPYSEGVMRTYRDAIRMARDAHGHHLPLIALGHMHATGGTTSDESERKIIIGGESAIPLASLADSFAYVALGHLHLAQKVGGFEHIRYCGSPMPLSFSEIKYRHQVVLIELQDGNKVDIRPLEIPRFVDMLRVPEKHEPLDSVIETLKALQFPDLPSHERPFLEVPVLLTGPTPDMQARIDDVLKKLPVRLGRIVARSEARSADGATLPPVDLETVRRIEPTEVFETVYRERWGTPPSEDLMNLFKEVCRAVAETKGREQ